MWFDFAREERFPTQFEAHKYPVTVDVLEVGLIFSFVLIAMCFYVILPGRRGLKFVSLGSRVTVSIILGAIILVSNFGQEWEVAHIKSKTPYKIGTGVEINADIGIKIGFRSVNVTLKSSNHSFGNETINYNERFEWNWDQGRFGFGPYAGLLQQEFRAAQYRGLPLPILWIVDYFVFDGEGLRFGRFYRTAGWYCHILMWIAFACWALANVFYASVIRYGNYYLGTAGILQLFACIIWSAVKNPMPLKIPFEDDVLVPVYGSSFYATLIGGILCVCLAVIIFILDLLLPHETAEFFNVDPLSEYDELHLTPEEMNTVRDKNKRNKSKTLDVCPLTDMETGNTSAQEENEQPKDKDIVLLKRRSTIMLPKTRAYHKYNKGTDMPEYGNIDTFSDTAPMSTPRLPPRQPRIPPKRKN